MLGADHHDTLQVTTVLHSQHIISFRCLCWHGFVEQPLASSLWDEGRGMPRQRNKGLSMQQTPQFGSLSDPTHDNDYTTVMNLTDTLAK